MNRPVLRVTAKASPFLLLVLTAVGTVTGAMDRATIRAGLESHDWALYIKDGWIRDPYGANLAVSQGEKLSGPFTHPMKVAMRGRHDPSIFRDDDGTYYLLWGNTLIAPMKPGFAGFAAEPRRVDPAGSRPGPDGEPIRRIGHEGATIRRIGGKYVHFGTAWSTDRTRKGTYNLSYSIADRITGPYGLRQFAGRFLGHGMPFQDKRGRWWCTAFFNANVPPISREDALKPSVGENAHTINEQGVTIVPLDVRVRDDGEIHIRAKDPAYARPGPEEAQKFPEADPERASPAF